jgi:hypothetical protein
LKIPATDSSDGLLSISVKLLERVFKASFPTAFTLNKKMVDKTEETSEKES